MGTIGGIKIRFNETNQRRLSIKSRTLSAIERRIPVMREKR